MPELPEVETMRRGVSKTVGLCIVDVIQSPCKAKKILIQPRISVFRQKASGRRILGTDRWGKRVVLRLDSGDVIVFEPRMTGLVLVADPPSTTHLRLQIDLAPVALSNTEPTRAASIWYWDRRGLGNVRLLSPRQVESLFGDERLGPDALSITAQILQKRLQSSRREIKTALLDQKALAGIGNLYASEILHLAKIHPQRRCDQLTSGQWKRLHGAMIKILEEAIHYEGSTLSDGTYRNSLSQPGGYQNHHCVYNRHGAVCPTCGKNSIERIIQAQRSTFFCPRCQRRPNAGNVNTQQKHRPAAKPPPTILVKSF